MTKAKDSEKKYFCQRFSVLVAVLVSILSGLALMYPLIFWIFGADFLNMNNWRSLTFVSIICSIISIVFGVISVVFSIKFTLESNPKERLAGGFLSLIMIAWSLFVVFVIAIPSVMDFTSGYSTYEGECHIRKSPSSTRNPIITELVVPGDQDPNYVYYMFFDTPGYSDVRLTFSSGKFELLRGELLDTMYTLEYSCKQPVKVNYLPNLGFLLDVGLK